jgi:hypothetical protein
VLLCVDRTVRPFQNFVDLLLKDDQALSLVRPDARTDRIWKKSEVWIQ